MERNAKIYVAGHRGMVGSAILRRLEEGGFSNFVCKTHSELNLCCQAEVNSFFASEKPDYVFLGAAKVGGIKANSLHMADFLYENLMIECNVINAAWRNGVKKLCYLGSSCIYPREAQQPMKESCLLTGPLEPTNEGYALAKIAGYKLCQYLKKEQGFRSVSLMPCNLYGKNDNFDLETCHVLSAFVHRFCDAVDEGRQSVELWGTGTPKREFMNVDDVASAAFMLMETYEDSSFVNIGIGKDLPIAELAGKVAKAAGFKGEIKWDSSMPDGMMRKVMDISKLKSLGFQPKISLEAGIAQLVEEYRTVKAAKGASWAK